MSNKSMQNIGNAIPKNLSPTDLYNLQVKEYLQKHPLTPIQQHAIKIFKEQAIRAKLTDIAYNKEVEQFNTRNGFILRKKGVSIANNSIDCNYSYINYPYLDREAIAQSMRNYRQYVRNYNLKVAEANRTINQYNKQVVEPSNTAEAERVRQFEKENHHLFTRNYNLLADNKNTKAGKRIYKKKRYQTVKYASEIFFHVLIGFYVKQLKMRNLHLLQLNKPTTIAKNSLKVRVNHRALAEHKIDDIPRLDICKKTAQNHVKRLREAGIFNNYEFINSNKPVNLFFNPKIIQVLDGKLPKKESVENQPFKTENDNVLHDNKDITRTNLKEKEKKDNAMSIGGLIGENFSNFPLIHLSADSYKNTNKANLQRKLPAFAEKESYVEKISENFRSRWQDEQLLAKDLAENVYVNYKGLRYEYLVKIDQYSNITKEEFATVLQQDVLKSASKIWKNHSVFVGEWKKTINLIKNTLFTSCSSKQQMIAKLKEYRWKLDFARRWFTKNNRNALFPFMYFDVNRTKSHELGFFGLHGVWKTHLNYQKKKYLEQKRLKNEASVRQIKSKNQLKLDRAINKYYSGKYNYQQLANYVMDHLGINYYRNLPTLLKNNVKFLA